MIVIQKMGLGGFIERDRIKFRTLRAALPYCQGWAPEKGPRKTPALKKGKHKR